MSRRTTTNGEKPLPNFGAGKSFPPPLPAMEEYVVEFDSHDVRYMPRIQAREPLLTTSGSASSTELAAQEEVGLPIFAC